MDYIHNKQISAIIKDISSKIVTALSPDKIILFGSYADGEPSKDSDIDLLIIKNMRERPAERQRIISRLFFPRTIPLDIIVKTPTEIEKAQQRVDPFINGILKKAKCFMRDPEELKEWLEKAEEDFEAAKTIMKRRRRPLPSIVCFHCQQAAEKYLKALLIFMKLHFPKHMIY